MKPDLPNLLLISGTGRKSGKTLLASKIIEHIRIKEPVVAIKISPHQHKGNSEPPLITGDGYQIWLETETLSEKDTARMVIAGASEVYYIECTDEALKEAFLILYKKIDSPAPIICESGNLWHVVKPGVFVMATNSDNEPKPSSIPLLPLADYVYELKEINDNFQPQSIIFVHGKWKLVK